MDASVMPEPAPSRQYKIPHRALEDVLHLVSLVDCDDDICQIRANSLVLISSYLGGTTLWN